MLSRVGARLAEALALAAACVVIGCSTDPPTIARAEATRAIPSNSTSWNPTAAAVSVANVTAASGIRPNVLLQLERSDAIQVEAGFCDTGGRCTCSVALPSPCAADKQFREIISIRQSLAGITSNVTTITARMNKIEETIHKQSASASLFEIDGLRKELHVVTSVLRTLEDKVNSTIITSLTRELDSILRQINALESDYPIAAQVTLEKQLDQLRARLAKCKDESQWLTYSPFPGDAVTYNETNYKSCSASPEIKVGPQVTHKMRDSSLNSWFRDARPPKVYRSSQIYEFRIIQGSHRLIEWQNYAHYSSERDESLYKFRCYPQPSGRKHVILGGFLYYFDPQNVGVVSKMDLMTCQVTHTLKLPVEQSALNKYLHGDPTYADINYDETGLYVVYTNAAVSGELVIAKVDPLNMILIRTWETGARLKSTLGNVFFVCGRMYTTDSHTVRHLTGKQYGYDTNTGSEFLVSIDVESRFGSVLQLAYNPRDRMIFGVDRYSAVTYDVHWN